MNLIDLCESPLPVDPIPQKRKTRKGSRKSVEGDLMAAYFMEHRGKVSALFLQEKFGLRWRTTVSDLRFPPYHMDIRWEPESYVNARGQKKQRSFYRFLPKAEQE